MGTMQKLALYDTPKYNGIVECLNCTLLEKVQAIMLAVYQKTSGVRL
jgi:hypothetical protein